jgi:hypothetical protein
VNPPTSINRKQLIALMGEALTALQKLMAEINPPNPDAEPGIEFYRPQKPPWQQSLYSCPQCGGPMVSRNGRRGPFFGCAAYPSCKGTVQPKANDDIRREMQARATASDR